MSKVAAEAIFPNKITAATLGIQRAGKNNRIYGNFIWKYKKNK
jgi:hypothetical protein